MPASSTGAKSSAYRTSRVIAGQVTDDARARLAEIAGVQVLALTDRVWQPEEAFERAALLVEEATVEAGRARWLSERRGSPEP